MFKRSKLLMVGLIAVFSVSAGLMAPASAAPSLHLTASVEAAATPLPTVKITQLSGQQAKFHPKTITVASKDFPKGCTRKVAVLRISNKTAATQTLTINGATLGVLAPGTNEIICASGPSGASGVVDMQGSHSTLTITLS